MVGLAIVVIDDGQIVLQKGYGETLVTSGDPVTEDTVFRWASLSKGVAATVALKQQDKGLMTMDDVIGPLAPSLKLPRGGERQAKVRDVLAHRLGITRNAYDNHLEGGKDPAAIRRSYADLPRECPVGTCHAYLNVGFDAIAEAIELRNGKTYFEVAQADILLPLGMRSVTMSRSGLQNSPRWARPHNRNGVNVYRRMSEAYFRVPAAGGVNGSIRDLGLWMQAQMGMRPDVVSLAMRDEMHSPAVLTPRELRRARRFYPRIQSADYGLGWRVYNYAGQKVVGHRGAVNGYRSAVIFDTDRRSGVGLLWNSSSNQPVGLQFLVMDSVYGLPAQDWLYFDEGPNLAALRGAHPRRNLNFDTPPVPNLFVSQEPDGLPADHGVPWFEVRDCFWGGDEAPVNTGFFRH